MEHELNSQRVWDDIQFELAQGLPSRDALGLSVLAAQKQQEALRAQVFGKGGRVGDQREIVARQFQVNETLLTLLQETATSLRRVQLDVERLSRAPYEGPSAIPPTATEVAAMGLAPGHSSGDASRTRATPTDATVGPGQARRPLDEVEQGMRPDALALSMPRESRPALPLVGSLIVRVKRAFHRLVLFHVRSLSEKQASINRIYGEWIRYQERLVERQEERLLELGRRVTAVEKRGSGADDPS